MVIICLNKPKVISVQQQSTHQNAVHFVDVRKPPAMVMSYWRRVCAWHRGDKRGEEISIIQHSEII